MSGGNPWMKFFPSDWRADAALRMCSIGARGLWMEMLCIMHDVPSGRLIINEKAINNKQLANLAGISAREIECLVSELEIAGVFSRDEDGTIYSRRIRRDQERAERDKGRGNSGGNPEIRRGTVPKENRVRPFKRSDAPAKTQRIWDRDNGRCHWCGVSLVSEMGPGGELPLNYFHVDHVIAVCDGGTNDESNLVAACAACNHKRARILNPTLTSVIVGSNNDSNADIKAHIPEARSHKPERKEETDAAPAARIDDWCSEVDLFKRGKEILKDTKAGGYIKNLLKANNGNILATRQALEIAATKENAREYIGGIIAHAKDDPDRLVKYDDGLPIEQWKADLYKTLR